MIDKNGVYILSIDGKYIVTAMENNGQYDTKDKDEIKLYNCTLPYSLDLIQLNKIAPKEIVAKDTFKNDSFLTKRYSKAIINITFNKSCYEYKDEKVNKINKKSGKVKEVSKKGKVIYSTKEIREKLYKDGFVLDGCKYVFYKRSSSKARLGSTLFIKKKLYDKMINWSRIDVKFKYSDIREQAEQVDIASLRAYESLTLSSIENIIKIKPDEILLIDDIKSTFKSLASVTSMNDDGTLVTETKEIENTNDIFDGQALLDESMFEQNKGMMLLRNRFFKSCAFNTKIQKFFSDNNVGTVTDMFGRELDAKKIKLITTPNSLKIFKFAYKIGSKEDTYQYWLDNLDENFGICKYEKPSKYNRYNKLSYQMINSMPLTKENVKELMKDELDYVHMLKNDINVFRHHISNHNTSPTREFIYNILAVNSKVKDTKMFKDYKTDIVFTYISDLKKGKIKLSNTDYAVLCGNPYEMLLHSIEKNIKETLHRGKEIYCSAYKDGEQLVGFRNPHICTGNVLLAKNIYHDEFKYFNFTNNIVIVNSFDNDLNDRLQGCDYDSDSCLLSNHSILIEKAVQCVNYPTPVSRIIPTQIKERYYSYIDMADVDYCISQNKIGEIVNWSQILNSYYWHIYNTTKDQGLLNIIYDKISMLSSLSQVEIDKAKKFFDIDMNKILNSLKSINLDGEAIIKSGTVNVFKTSITNEELEVVKDLKSKIKTNKNNSDMIKCIKQDIIEITKNDREKMIRPMFFKYCGEGREYKFEKFETAMDYLQEIIDKIPMSKTTKSIHMSEALIDDGNLSKANRRQIINIKNIIKELNLNINLIYQDKNRDKNQDRELIKKMQYQVIERIRKFNFYVDTMLSIFNTIYGLYSKDKEMVKYKQLLLSILWMAQKDVMIKAFKRLSDNTVGELMKNDNGKIIIWGAKYGLNTSQ